jgi:L-iditol 2-dehydrogenase
MPSKTTSAAPPPAAAAMSALVLHGIGDLRLERIPTPAPGPGMARVCVGFCGVCGSDIPRIFKKGTYRFPTVCGHEFAGVIESCGEGAGDFKPGDRVAVFPLLWCGRCAACERGEYVQCRDYDYLGSRRDGAFAEYVAAPVRNLKRVPEGVGLEEAAMAEPAAVALHALKRAGGCAPGETVAVFGAGPIGLMVAQWARALGATRIAVFDVVAEKLEQARRLGFAHAYDSRARDPIAAIGELTRGEGAHLAIDAAGAPAALTAALAAARRGGRAVVLGNPAGDATLPAELISQLMRREVAILGTWNSSYSAAGNDDDWSAALEAMASGVLDLKPLITHSVSLSEAPPVLEAMRDGRGVFSKVLIRP